MNSISPAWPFFNSRSGLTRRDAASAWQAATSTSHYVQAHSALTASSGIALDHGFRTALYVLTGLLVLGALIAVTLVRSAPMRRANAERADGEVVVLDEAA